MGSTHSVEAARVHADAARVRVDAQRDMHGHYVGFDVDKVWRREKKKILIDRLRWNSSNI